MSNFTDMVTKNRAKFRDNKATGDRNRNSKLNAEAVISIRDMYARGILNQYELADMYGVTQSAIGSVIRNKTWRHV